MDELATAREQLLREGRSHVSDLVPDILAAHSEHHFILALEDVDHDWLAVVVREVGLARSVGLALLEVGLGLHSVDYLQVVHSPPPQLATDLVVPRAQQSVVVCALPHLEVQRTDAIDLDLQDGGLEGHFLLLNARRDDEFELTLRLHPLVLLDVDVDSGVGRVRVEADGELHGRHGSEDVHFLLKLDGLVVGVEEYVFEVGLRVDGLDVEAVVDDGQEEVLLALVEVVISL